MVTDNFTFDPNGTTSTKRTRVEFKECTIDSFKTLYEKGIFLKEATNWKSYKPYCLDDPDDKLYVFGNLLSLA